MKTNFFEQYIFSDFWSVKKDIKDPKSIQYSNFVKTKLADKMPRALEKETIDSAVIAIFSS